MKHEHLLLCYSLRSSLYCTLVANPARRSFENAIRVTARSQNRVPTLDEAGMIHQAKPSLAQFCGHDGISDYYGMSKEILRNLGYVRVNDDDSMALAMDHNVLSMVWELR